jgi:hypothetical protein
MNPPTGWYASYRVTNPNIPEGTPGSSYFNRVPVAYWEDGCGWVSVAQYQKQPGHLMRADEVRFANWEFRGYYPDNKIVAVLPGGGWSARYTDMDGSGGHGDSPILAWLVREDGAVTAFDMSVDGCGGDPCEMSNFDQLVPPNEAEQTVEADS